MSSLGWKINRIKAMGFEEITFRVSRAIQQKFERRRLEKGWQPLPITPVTKAKPLFIADISAIQNKWSSMYGEFDESAYERSLSKINLFSHFDVDISLPIDWHKDPDTGVKSLLKYGKDIDYRDNSEVGNCKTLWELSRHKHLVPLAVAYAMTGKTSYADRIVGHIDGWVEQNPYGFGVHWCSSLEVALRLIAWCFTHQIMSLRHPNGLFDLLKNSNRFGISVYQHVFFIVHYLSRYSSANNHLIGELTGIWIGCNLFDLGREGKEWSSFAKKELELEASKQVFSDGVSREQATYYHLWVNEYLLLVWLIGERYDTPFSRQFVKRISLMTQFLHDMRPKGGQVPQIGDSDDGLVLGFDPENKINPYDDLFQTYSLLTNKGKLSNSESVSKAFWYGEILDRSDEDDSLISPLVDNQEALKVYPQGGYAIIQDGSFHALFDAGPLGYPSIAAHGHADALSICVAWDGEWWIVDPGTYCYHTDPFWRDYFRGTGAHNTVMIDNMNQSSIGGAFLWLKHANVEMFSNTEKGEIGVGGAVVGVSSDGIKHRRHLRYSKINKELCVMDSIESPVDVEFEIRFNFHPAVSVEFVKVNELQAVRRESVRKVTFTLDESIDWSLHSGEINPPIGWYSETLGLKKPCMVLLGKGKCPNVTSSCLTIRSQ